MINKNNKAGKKSRHKETGGKKILNYNLPQSRMEYSDVKTKVGLNIFPAVDY